MNFVKSCKNGRGFVSIVIVTLLLPGMFLFFGCAKEEPVKENELSETLTILNWEDYIEMDVVKEFEDKYNVNVVFVYYENEDEMISLVQSNPESYDLVIASGSVVKKMQNLRLIDKIEKENIPNLSKVDVKFTNSPFDKNLEYSIPYLWGTSGVTVNRKYVKDEEIGWEILFDKRYAGKIDMLDDIQENFAPPLKILGVSINANDEETLEKARGLLMEQRGIIRGYFDAYEIQKHLEDGTVYVAYHYSGDTYMAMEKNEDLEFIVPKEGSPIWIDNWVIPTNAKNKYTAEVFVNFVLMPKNIAKISNYVWYANPVPESREFLNEELLSSEDIYISDDILKKCEYYVPLESQTNIFMNKVWSELKR